MPISAIVLNPGCALMMRATPLTMHGRGSRVSMNAAFYIKCDIRLS